jgi:DNA anti-recombination protein RmuC
MSLQPILNRIQNIVKVNETLQEELVDVTNTVFAEIDSLLDQIETQQNTINDLNRKIQDLEEVIDDLQKILLIKKMDNEN